MLIRREAANAMDPAIGFSYSDDTETLIDDLAKPFLDLAEKLEATRLNDFDDHTRNAVLDANAYVWRFVANFLPRQLSKDVSPEMADLIVRISDFMQQAGIQLRKQNDEGLIKRLVELNLNMCNQILSLRKEMLGPDA